MPALPLPLHKLSDAVLRLCSSSASEQRNDAIPKRKQRRKDNVARSGANPIFLSRSDPLLIVSGGSEPVLFTYVEMLREVVNHSRKGIRFSQADHQIECYSGIKWYKSKEISLIYTAKTAHSSRSQEKMKEHDGHLSHLTGLRIPCQVSPHPPSRSRLLSCATPRGSTGMREII